MLFGMLVPNFVNTVVIQIMTFNSPVGESLLSGRLWKVAASTKTCLFEFAGSKKPVFERFGDVQKDRTDHTIFSVKVSPDLVFLDIRKSIFNVRLPEEEDLLLLEEEDLLLPEEEDILLLEEEDLLLLKEEDLLLLEEEDLLLLEESDLLLLEEEDLLLLKEEDLLLLEEEEDLLFLEEEDLLLLEEDLITQVQKGSARFNKVRRGSTCVQVRTEPMDHPEHPEKVPFPEKVRFRFRFFGFPDFQIFDSRVLSFCKICLKNMLV